MAARQPAIPSTYITRPSLADAPLSLPDFCNIRVALVLIAVGELVAIILAIGAPGAPAEKWATLGLLSLFTQLVALSWAVLLCHTRRYLARFRDGTAGILAHLLIVAITVLVTELAMIAARGTGLEFILPPQRHVEFLLQNVAIAVIIGAVILRYFYVQAHLRRTVAAEARARLQALQARIRPHFMFNCMNTIASLTRSDPALAEEVVEDLSELFRDALADTDRPSTLGHEIELARRYLHIEQLRLGDRLRVEERCQDIPLDAYAPSLLIQPLVENAVYHGVEPLVDGGTITIEAALEKGLITITICNPCPPSPRPALRPGNHMGLENTRERLTLQFGGRAGLESGSENGRFTVKLVFPCQREAP